MATDGFLSYEPKHLKKINAIRQLISAPDAKLPPILNNGQVLFSAAQADPRSCTNCVFYNYGRSCQLLGEHVTIKKFIWPPQATAEAKVIEYWPVCGYWVGGDPNFGKERFSASLNPDDAGLSWINAPEVGQAKGGTSCGGQNGGDDCDYYMTAGDDKRAEPTGFCRVLQRETENMACCSAWLDDDIVNWRTAQERIRELDGE